MQPQVYMQEPVEIALFKGGALMAERTAVTDDDLIFNIEMLTGVGWIDAASQYQTLMASTKEQVTQIYRVCHSYEKWGAWQQEVENIKLRMRRIHC